jgi:chorismate--pyruvate lyase
VNALQASVAMRGWLTDRTSLTQKLCAHYPYFQVRCLQQGPASCTADEAALLGLTRRRKVQQREVVLLGDGQTLVYAHTVLPLQANAADWPLYRRLGARSLGTSLFGDPLVRRGALHYARLRPSHPLAQRAAAALGQVQPRWFARRCLFWRKQGVLLVTEIFSPAVAAGAAGIITPTSASIAE